MILWCVMPVARYIIPKLVIWASRELSSPSCQWAAPLVILFSSIRDEKNKMPLAAVCLWFPTTPCQLPLVLSSVACRLSLATLRLTWTPGKKCIGEPTLKRCVSSSYLHFAGKCSSCSEIQRFTIPHSAPGFWRKITLKIIHTIGFSLHADSKVLVFRSANWIFKAPEAYMLLHENLKKKKSLCNLKLSYGIRL